MVHLNEPNFLMTEHNISLSEFLETKQKTTWFEVLKTKNKSKMIIRFPTGYKKFRQLQ